MMVRFLERDRLDTAGKLTEYSSGVRTADMTSGKLRTTVFAAGQAIGRRTKRSLDSTLEDNGDRQQAGTEALDDLQGIAGRGGNTIGRGTGSTVRRGTDSAVKAGHTTTRPFPPAPAPVHAPTAQAAGTGPGLARSLAPTTPIRRFAIPTGRMPASRGAAARQVTDAVSQAMHAAAVSIRRAAAAVANAVSAFIGTPAALAVIGIVAVIAVLAAMLAWLPGFAVNQGCADTRTEIAIPAQATPWVAKASETSGLGQDFIAAMMTIESGFRADAYADDSNGGTWGLLQINREVWRSVHPDGADATPPEGITDPMTHAEYGGMYLARRLDTVRRLKTANPSAEFSTLDDLDALVIAHNAGEGGLMGWPRIPQVTRTYLDKMHAMLGGEDRPVCPSGGVIGSLDPPLALNGDLTAVDLEAMDLPEATTYARWECTWWAATRRAHIGRPVDPYMGDGAMWRDSAKAHGYPTGKEPEPGDVMVFQRSILAASPVYGHVAIVEEVRADGGIVISESSSSSARVTLRTISRRQLETAISGIDFIH